MPAGFGQLIKKAYFPLKTLTTATRKAYSPLLFSELITPILHPHKSSRKDSFQDSITSVFDLRLQTI